MARGTLPLPGLRCGTSTTTLQLVIRSLRRSSRSIRFAINLSSASDVSMFLKAICGGISIECSSELGVQVSDLIGETQLRRDD
jgi:hypothetical protein